jgi:hypothetical protein
MGEACRINKHCIQGYLQKLNDTIELKKLGTKPISKNRPKGTTVNSFGLGEVPVARLLNLVITHKGFPCLSAVNLSRGTLLYRVS